jgi:hypothetical protein
MNTHWHCVYAWIAVPDFSGRFELFLAVLYLPIVVDKPFDCVLSKIEYIAESFSLRSVRTRSEPSSDSPTWTNSQRNKCFLFLSVLHGCPRLVRVEAFHFIEFVECTRP